MKGTGQNHSETSERVESSSAPQFDYDGAPSLGLHLDRDTTRSFPVHADRAFGEGPASIPAIPLTTENLDAHIDSLLDRLTGGAK